MKRRLIICSSLITLLLSCFSFPIFAEETVQDSSTFHTLSDGVFLDSYFYENYDVLPYISGNNGSYIDTGYKPNNNTVVQTKFKINYFDTNASQYLFASLENTNNGVRRYALRSYMNQDNVILAFDYDTSTWSKKLEEYVIYDLVFGQDVYVNNELIYSFNDAVFQNDYNLYIMAMNNSGTVNYYGGYDIYSFKIAEYDSVEDSYTYVRYYYPAKSKASGTIGLYDAVTKTFFASGSQFPFTSPTNEYVENFQISSFLTNSLTWIGQIFTAIIQMPIIIVFMAIGLAGAMFRWGRRIVHF